MKPVDLDLALRATLEKAIPHITAPALLDAVTTFLVTGSWRSELGGDMYRWTDILNQGVENVMFRYCVYTAHDAKSSVMSQLHCREALLRSLTQLQISLSHAPVLDPLPLGV